MKFNKEKNIKDVTKFGFFHIDEIRNDLDEYDFLFYLKDAYLYSFGHSRRGQYYYMIIENNNVTLYTSKPDGDGGSVLLDDTIFNMIEQGYLISENT